MVQDIKLKRGDVRKYKKVLKQVEEVNEYPVHWLDKLRLKIYNHYHVIKIILKFYKEAKMPQNQNRQSIVRIVITSILSLVTFFFGVEVPADVVTNIIAGVLGIWSAVEFFLFKKNKDENSNNNQ